MRPMVLIHDVPDTAGGAAAAGVLFKGFDVIAVIVKKLLALFDAALGNDPNVPADDLGLAIGVAGMVDVLGRVVVHMAIDVVGFVQLKDIHRPLLMMLAGIFNEQRPPALRFGLG